MSLHESVEARDLKTVKALLKDGCDPDILSEEGDSALHIVEDTAIAKALIEAGANVNIKDPEGWTPLHYVENDIELAKLLLASGADVNARSNEDELPIHVNSNEAVIALLLDAQSDINQKNIDDKTALFTAVTSGHMEVVKKLIKAGADVKTVNHDGWTLLHAGVRHGTKMVNLLVKKGLDVNAEDYDGYRPIHYAQDPTVINCLAKHGAEVNVTAFTGVTALHLRAIEGNSNAVDALIRLDADVNARDKDMITPLYACNDLKSATLLLEAKADPNVIYDGETLLDRLIDEDKDKLATLAEKYGAKMKSQLDSRN